MWAERHWFRQILVDAFERLRICGGREQLSISQRRAQYGSQRTSSIQTQLPGPDDLTGGCAARGGGRDQRGDHGDALAVEKFGCFSGAEHGETFKIACALADPCWPQKKGTPFALSSAPRFFV